MSVLNLTDFISFLPAERVHNVQELQGHVRRAVIDVYMLLQAGMPLDKVSTLNVVDYSAAEPQLSDNGIILNYKGGVRLENILNSLLSEARDENSPGSEAIEVVETESPGQDLAATRENSDHTTTTSSHEALPLEESILTLQLSDASTKFAVRWLSNDRGIF
jgi:hypothetical protein